MKNRLSLDGARAPVSVRARRTTLPLAALSAAIAVALPGLALAQPSLPETVVTATRVAQPLSDLTSDVSIVDRETIERSGATGVADVLESRPGI